MSKVTVCIPTYNRAGFLKEAIESVLAQSYGDFELLIADNASTDGTGDVVSGFNDRRIRYHRHERNIGMSANFRFLFASATTDYVANLADDDLFMPDHLLRSFENLDQYPNAVYSSCPALKFGATSTGQDFLRPHAITDTQTPTQFFAPSDAVRFLGLDTPGPMMFMCRRSAFHKDFYWGKDDFIPGDMIWLTQLLVQGGFVFGNHSTTKFRVHSGSASSSSETRKRVWRFNAMAWQGIRWNCEYLLRKGVCSLADIERHGMTAKSEQHVVPLVLALSSLSSPRSLRMIASRVFHARKDMDGASSRFRTARRWGFWTLPFFEKFTRIRSGWAG